jgi:hypothetical protein
MSLLRTLGASARFARAAPRAGVGAWAAAARRAPAIAARGRSLATEVGFLDEDVVAGRVVEVVRKFEKVRRCALCVCCAPGRTLVRLCA